MTTGEESMNNNKSNIPPTEMIYYNYDGNFELECDAKVLSCQFIDSNHKKNETSNESSSSSSSTKTLLQLCLDKTVMHAQGGGQPTDIGYIVNKNNETIKINITKVLMDRSTGVATHTGTLVNENDNGNDDNNNNNILLLQPGDDVHVSVDAANREILSECHTAGHVVDSAMAKCGTVLPPLKGYHFLDGPYVEYKGKIPDKERGPLLEKLQQAFQELVQEDIPTQIEVLSKQQANDVCNRVAENYFNMDDFGNQDETVRIVTVAGWPCPCGGTHVKSTGKLQARQWGITGFRNKKGVVRVKYGPNWQDQK